MATVTLLASDGLSSASPTITSTATITAAVGDWLLVAIAANNRQADGSSHWADTISDSDGINTYITRVNVNYNPAGTNTGATVILVTAAVTDALTNATISMTWDTAAFGAGAYQIFRIHPGAGEAISFVAADTTGSTGAATLHSAATVSVALGNMIFGAAAIETNIAITGDSDTSNGSWSALSTDFYPNATDTLGMTTAVQWKTVTGTGNQSWSCSTTSAKDSARSYLVLHLASAAFSLAAAQGQYTLSGTAMTPKLGHVPLTVLPGSYALTGSTVTLINSATEKIITVDSGSYALTGTDVTLTKASNNKTLAADSGSYALTGTSANFVLMAGATTYFLSGTDVALTLAHFSAADAGSYVLTGTTAVLTKAGVNKVLGVDSGVYGLTGADVTLTAASNNKLLAVDPGSYALAGSAATPILVAAKSVVADPGSYAMTGTTTPTTHQWKATASNVGAYALAGSDVALSATANKAILGSPGSYVFTGNDVTLSLEEAPFVPVVSQLHIGEWPVDKKRRRAREDARAKEQRARDRFRRAIDRLLEGLPPEFDEPADLDEALDSAVQASNLLYALSAPIAEINAVNELIDHIRQVHIAHPIAQGHLAQAYNQAHRHLMFKAEEDAAMALLLGETF